jgi:hypothetical protein
LGACISEFIPIHWEISVDTGVFVFFLFIGGFTERVQNNIPKLLVLDISTSMYISVLYPSIMRRRLTEKLPLGGTTGGGCWRKRGTARGIAMMACIKEEHLTHEKTGRTAN